jgi:hypothetical protein
MSFTLFSRIDDGFYIVLMMCFFLSLSEVSALPGAEWVHWSGRGLWAGGVQAAMDHRRLPSPSQMAGGAALSSDAVPLPHSPPSFIAGRQSRPVCFHQQAARSVCHEEFVEHY